MKIEINGPIVSDGDKFIYDWFGIPATSPKNINDAIRNAKDNEELEIKINSPGGSVFSGSEIYTNLMDYKGKKVVKITGIAASAASVIAMAGTEVLISPTAQIMIHNAMCGDNGDYRSKLHTAEVLESINKSISNAYKIKTGMSHEELLDLMGKETWMTSQVAVENKFADKVMFSDNNFMNSVETNSDGTLSQAVIDKMRVQLKNDPNFTNSTTTIKPVNDKIKELELAKAKLIAKYK